MNAVEIVNSFTSLDDLRLFKDWVESPGDDLMTLLNNTGNGQGEGGAGYK